MLFISKTLTEFLCLFFNVVELGTKLEWGARVYSYNQKSHKCLLKGSTQRKKSFKPLNHKEFKKIIVVLKNNATKEKLFRDQISSRLRLL